MGSLTAPEVLAPDTSAQRKSLEVEITRPDDRRAIRGVLLGVALGAGAWGMLWVVASALLHHRG